MTVRLAFGGLTFRTPVQELRAVLDEIPRDVGELLELIF